MFEVNDYVVYGTIGVCQVEEICDSPMGGADSSRKYYMLKPVYNVGNKVYTPVDSLKVSIRKILTEQEAWELIHNIREISTIWVGDEKMRENLYKAAIKSNDCHEWIKIIKTLYMRKEQRIAEGKQITATDSRYMQEAEKLLYGELALSLNIDRDKVVDYINEQVAEIEEKETN